MGVPANDTAGSPPAGTAAGATEVTGLLEQARAENFPVASRVLPSRVRAHLMAIYGYARLVDHVGDEAEGDRLALLAWLESDVARLYETGDARHPLVRALAPTIERFGIAPTPFLALIEANRRDQIVSRYATFDDLLEYCTLSANPVGHLVLSVLEALTPRHIILSDRICTGLQLAEHWQDVAEDFDAGRIYLPAEDLERFGVGEHDLRARRVSEGFRRLMAFEVERAAALLDAGLELVGALDGRGRVAVAAFLAGGKSALRAIELGGYDVLTAAPRPHRLLRVRTFLDTLFAAGRGGAA